MAYFQPGSAGELGEGNFLSGHHVAYIDQHRDALAFFTFGVYKGLTNDCLPVQLHASEWVHMHTHSSQVLFRLAVLGCLVPFQCPWFSNPIDKCAAEVP